MKRILNLSLALLLLSWRICGAGQEIIIQQVQPEFPVERIAEERAPHITIVSAYETPKSGESELPPPEDVRALVAEAGLTPAVGAWDTLDRDMLYLRARDSQDLKEAHLLGAYPQLPPDKLRRLKALVGKRAEHGPAGAKK